MATEGHPYTPEKLPLWQLDAEQPFNGEEKQKENHGKQFSATDTDTSSDQGWFSRNRSGKQRKFDPESVLPYVDSEQTLKPARMPPPVTVYDYIPLLRFFKWAVHTVLRKAQPGMQKRRKKNPFSELVESNVPLEISLILQG
jgi:putative membrane protein